MVGVTARGSQCVRKHAYRGGDQLLSSQILCSIPPTICVFRQRTSCTQGVRTTLIDRDSTPAWLPPTLEEVRRPAYPVQGHVVLLCSLLLVHMHKVVCLLSTCIKCRHCSSMPGVPSAFHANHVQTLRDPFTVCNNLGDGGDGWPLLRPAVKGTGAGTPSRRNWPRQ